MKKSKCIFCMNEKEESEQICPVCKKGLWEYEWREGFLEPYVVLRSKYMIGAALEQDGHTVRYAGYDLVLEQKVLVYEYPEEFWRAEKEQKVKGVFGKILSSGMAVIKDYFLENGKGYMITTFPEGEGLENYIKKRHKIEEEEVIRLLRPVLRAVSGLHAAGQIHGNITPDHLMVMKDGTLRLLADCKGRVSEGNTDEYKAPEQQDSEGILGPWTDVYALCAVWYEMVTGHKIQAASDRMKNDSVRSPHWYTKIRDKTERALMQGISLESQMRFFSIGNLLESIDLPREEEEREMGVIRHIWGDAWLNTSQQEKKRKRKKRVKGYLLKRIAIGMICLAALAGMSSVGIYVYIQTHQPDYFAWKVEREQKKIKNEQNEKVFDKKDLEYAEIREYLLQYGEEKKYDGYSEYEVKEKDWDKCPIDQGGENTFCIDFETAKNAVEYYMGIDQKLDLADEAGSMLGYVEDDEKGRIRLSSGKDETYKVRGKTETAIFTYDPLNERLMGIEYQGSRERCIRFLEKLSSLLFTETYLTKEECVELGNLSIPRGESVRLRLNARYLIDISYQDNIAKNEDSIYSIKIQPMSSGEDQYYSLFQENKKDDTVYAGNYKRGSERYKEFISYVKEHAVSKEKVKEDKDYQDEKEAVLYTLDEKDVIQWGEPCNNYRFLVQAEDVIRDLKKKGYQMKKISEKKRNTVEIQKYGSILTTFKTVEHYQMTENINLGLVKDSINDDVIQLVVYRSNESAADLDDAAVDAGVSAADFQKKDREDLKEFVSSMWRRVKSEKTANFLFNENLEIIIQEYENTGNAFFIVPLEFAGDSPYYWPQ
ncbi:MAG TPA: hypothetical protein H9754_04325 [Candidatus Anaerostipes avistercoris]|uniref:Protein kinase domain-containing protein n=1 Tax=Candidatus Anaerostipes avistercoris TaxID=2838462 RepID=A0A9D2PID2_9FIRM|nr:hypothetical protein [Candidatus Anaerostipes avistercoris]